MARLKKAYTRGMTLALFVSALSAFNFMNLEGSGNFRAIHIVTLLVCGMGIGVFLTNFLQWIRRRRE